MDGNGNPVPLNGGTTSDSVTFTFTASDNAGGSGIKSIQCISDSDLQYYDCTSPHTYTYGNRAPGHIFAVESLDNAGNLGGYAWSWEGTGILPMVQYVSPADGATGVSVQLSIYRSHI